MSKIKKNFAEALLTWRIKKGLTQEEVGNRMGLSRSIISFLETGKQLPKPIHLILFRDKWNVDFENDYSFTEDDRPEYGLSTKLNQSTAQFLELYNSMKEVKDDMYYIIDLIKANKSLIDSLPIQVKDIFQKIENRIEISFRKF